MPEDEVKKGKLSKNATKDDIIDAIDKFLLEKNLLLSGFDKDKSPEK